MSKLPIGASAVLLLLLSGAASTAWAGEGSSSGKPDADKAIRSGLAWLARHQGEDGSWSAESLAKRCDPDSPCFHASIEQLGVFDDGVTGLALLAFLRAGMLPESTEKLADSVLDTNHVAGEVVTRGLGWLVLRQTQRGSFGEELAHMYNEAIATLAIVEAYSATKDEQWREPAQRAVEFLQGAQRVHPSGEGLWGWRYLARQDLEPAGEQSDSDTSATGWAVAALAAARSAGLEVSGDAFDGAVDFLDFASTTDGLVGYLNYEVAGMKVEGPHDQFDYHVGTMSALGIVIRLGAEFEPTHEFFAAAARQITKDLPRVSSDKLSVDYYYWYHGSIALNLLQDHPVSKKAKKKYAAAWNEALIKSACEIQDRSKDRCGAGSWILADRWSHYGGPVYSTAMCMLALETCASRK